MESTKSEVWAHIYEINARERLSIKSGGNVYQITKALERSKITSTQAYGRRTERCRFGIDNSIKS